MKCTGSSCRKWYVAMHSIVLATAIFTLAPQTYAQQYKETTVKTIGKPATDASVAISADGVAVVAFTATKINGGIASVTGVKASRCNDIACDGKTVFFRDAAGLGSPEIALDSSGRAVVAYVRQGAESEEIWLATCVTVGCQRLKKTKIAEGQGPLDLAIDSNDNAVVAYQYGEELRLGWCSNTACDIPVISIIDMLGGDPSLALTSIDNPVISYKSRSPRGTKIAVCADVACAAIANVADIPRVTFGKATSIAVNSNDLPVMAADDADGGMKVISCKDSLCKGIFTRGRAGLGGDTISMTLDDSDNPVIVYVTSRINMLKCSDPLCSDAPTYRGFSVAPLNEPVDSPAIALGPDGRPMIAYEATDNRVRLISCGDPLCGASGLENGAIYHLQNVTTGEYLDPRSSGLVSMASTPAKRTRFRLNRLRTGVFQISPIDFSTFLDPKGATLSQSFRARRDNQWRLQINSDGTHFIRNVVTASNLVVSGSEPQLVRNFGANAADRWQFVLANSEVNTLPFVGQQVALKNVATGRWLDADKNGSVNQSRNRQNDDVWKISYSDFDYAFLRNEAFGRYLDADRNNSLVRTSASARIDDRWDLEEVENGVFTLRNVRFGGYLTAPGAGQQFDVETSSVVTPSAQWRIAPIQ